MMFRDYACPNTCAQIYLSTRINALFRTARQLFVQGNAFEHASGGSEPSLFLVDILSVVRKALSQLQPDSSELHVVFDQGFHSDYEVIESTLIVVQQPR